MQDISQVSKAWILNNFLKPMLENEGVPEAKYW